MKNKICIIKANYYPDISDLLLKGALKVLKKYEYDDPITVSGIFELPVVIAKVINNYDAIVALGCVIKGKTPHFNIISRTVVKAIMDLSIKSKKPIGNGVIACLNKKQAVERAHPNKKDKGGEAARAVLSVLRTFENAE